MGVIVWSVAPWQGGGNFGRQNIFVRKFFSPKHNICGWKSSILMKCGGKIEILSTYKLLCLKSQSVNQKSKHACVAPYVATESQALLFDYFWSAGYVIFSSL